MLYQIQDGGPTPKAGSPWGEPVEEGDCMLRQCPRVQLRVLAAAWSGSWLEGEKNMPRTQESLYGIPCRSDSQGRDPVSGCAIFPNNHPKLQMYSPSSAWQKQVHLPLARWVDVVGFLLLCQQAAAEVVLTLMPREVFLVWFWKMTCTPASHHILPQHLALLGTFGVK